MRAGVNLRFRKRFARIGAIVCLVAVSIAGTAQDSGTQNDLERVRGEITRLRKQLHRVKRQARSAEQELASMDLQTVILAKELEVAVEETRELELQKMNINTEIGRLTERIGRQQKYLASRLSALYRLGSLSYLRILLSLDEKKNPFEAAAMMSYLINRDARAVTQFQESKTRLATRQNELAEKQRRIAESRRVVAVRTAALQRSRRDKEMLLVRLRSQSDESVQKIAELEEKAKRLERLFQLLYERPQSGQVTGAKIEEFKGALQWPLSGRIAEPFGPKRNAKFATVTVSNGLKLEAPIGTEVHAVFEGTVVFAQWFKGYGNLVIVDHGNRVFSLYGNTRGNSVSTGDKIAPGQIIGQVAEGEDGSSGYLYFEIREDNKPVDPQTWLR
jgi:murein hydrolase activator